MFYIKGDKGTLTASNKTRKNKNKVINYAKLSQSNHRSCMALPGAGKQILRTKALVWNLNISRKLGLTNTAQTTSPIVKCHEKYRSGDI